jgi:hypothetical protein
MGREGDSGSGSSASACFLLGLEGLAGGEGDCFGLEERNFCASAAGALIAIRDVIYVSLLGEGGNC